MAISKDLIEKLDDIHVHVATYSPGDGQTRYRFYASREKYDYFAVPGITVLTTMLGRRDAEIYAAGLLVGSNLPYTD